MLVWLGFEGVVKMINAQPVKGLHVSEVEGRRARFGTNERPSKPLRTVCEIVCTVLKDVMLRILLGASVVTIIINMIVEEHDRGIGESLSRAGSLDRRRGYLCGGIRGVLCVHDQRLQEGTAV